MRHVDARHGRRRAIEIRDTFCCRTARHASTSLSASSVVAQPPAEQPLSEYLRKRSSRQLVLASRPDHAGELRGRILVPWRCLYTVVTSEGLLRRTMSWRPDAERLHHTEREAMPTAAPLIF